MIIIQVIFRFHFSSGFIGFSGVVSKPSVYHVEFVNFHRGLSEHVRARPMDGMEL